MGMTELVMVADAEPLVSSWYYVGCAFFVVLASFNVWRFRTGWRMTGRHYRRGTTEYSIQLGYASIPNLVSALAAPLAGVLATMAANTHSALFGLGTLACAGLFIGGILVGIRERKRPSKWNRTPPWLVEARRGGRLR